MPVLNGKLYLDTTNLALFHSNCPEDKLDPAVIDVTGDLEYEMLVARRIEHDFDDLTAIEMAT